MGTIIQTRCFSIDEQKGIFRQTIGLRPTQIDKGAGWVDIDTRFKAGDINLPHVCDNAPMLTYVAADGMRRICPTHDKEKYFEIGAPYLKPGASWNKISLGAATRTANKLSWQTAQADVNVYHGGHFVKMEIPLKNGWQPPNGVLAFPIGIQGLTRKGTDIYDGDKLVMHLQAPVVYDAANLLDTRPIKSDLVKVGAQNYILFTLPDLRGMTGPVIDPTLTLQPGAAAGKDEFLYSSSPTFNYGVYVDLITGTSRRFLIFFSCSSIPNSAICNSAVLSVFQTGTGTPSSGTITLYSVSLSNSAWTEGIRNGALALSGESCWNALAADGAGGVTTAWAGSAGLSTSGTDYEATSLGSLSGNRSDPNGTEYSAILSVTRIKNWFGVINTNYGLLGIGLGSLGAVGSSDHTTAGYRPKLVVVYTLPGGGILNPALAAPMRGPFG